MASEDPPSAFRAHSGSDRNPKDPHRISVPFVPPNPYDILPPGADEKHFTPITMEPKRDSQYIPYSPDTINPIEQDPNQLPQVVIEDAPEVVGFEGAGAGSSTSPIVDGTVKEGAAGHISNNFPPPNNIGFSKGAATDEDDDEPEGCINWVKNRSKRSTRLFVIGVVVIAAIIGISIGVAVAVTNKSRQGYVDLSKPHGASSDGTSDASSPTETDPGLTSDSSSTDETSATETSGTNTSETPSPTSTPKPATDTSRCESETTWFTQLGFLATYDTTKMAEWLYAPVTTPEDCCMACYTNTVTKEGGCLAWKWDPYQEGKEFRCTNYQINNMGGDDETCPGGYEAMVFNDQDETIPNTVGDIGPCGKENNSRA